MILFFLCFLASKQDFAKKEGKGTASRSSHVSWCVLVLSFHLRKQDKF